MQYIYYCNFTTAEQPLHLEIAASADEENPNEEVDQGDLLPEEGEGTVDQGGLLPEEGEGTQESPYFSNQAGDKSGEISPPVVDDPVLSSSTQQSCKLPVFWNEGTVRGPTEKGWISLKRNQKTQQPQKCPGTSPTRVNPEGQACYKEFFDSEFMW